VVTSYLANARRRHPAQKDRGEVKHSTKKPWRQKGTGRAPRRHDLEPAVAGRRRIFPNRPDENFSHKLNRKMYRAGVCAILSQSRQPKGGSRWSTASRRRTENPAAGAEVKSMGFDNVLIVTDSVDENLAAFGRAICPTSASSRSAHADPVSLIVTPTVLLTKTRWPNSRSC